MGWTRSALKARICVVIVTTFTLDGTIKALIYVKVISLRTDTTSFVGLVIFKTIDTGNTVSIFFLEAAFYPCFVVDNEIKISDSKPIFVAFDRYHQVSVVVRNFLKTDNKR